MPSLAAFVLAAGLVPVQAQVSDGVVKIGVINDQSGMYADITGPRSVAAVKMAVEDFGGTVLGKPIEVVVGDHQNKVDIAAAIAQKWIDVDHVDVITDATGSGVALAMQEITRRTNRNLLVASAASSDLTGTSKAKIVGLATASSDTINTVKQIGEFGLTVKGQKVGGLLVFINDIDGIYAAVFHYLKAVQAAGTDEAKAVAKKMRELPVNDFYNKNVEVRADGRVMHKMYLMQVKSPAESKHKFDYYKPIKDIAPADAFRPLEEGGCPLIAKK